MHGVGGALEPNATSWRTRIAEAAVVGKWDDRWGEVPVVFTTSTDERLTREEVIEMCLGKTANYRLPKEVHFVAMGVLPRSTSGKIQRHLLEERSGWGT